VARRTYTDEEKAEALAIYQEHGPTAAQDALGIPKGTVTKWAKQAGVKTRVLENLQAGLKASHLAFEQRRINLAHGLLDDIARLRSQLFAPCKKVEITTVSDGQQQGSHVEVVEALLDEPTFADKKAILTSIGIAVDKVQLLSGGATSRHEEVDVTAQVAQLRDELAERRAKRVA